MSKSYAIQTLIAFDTLPDSALVDVLVYARLLGCSENTIWRRARSGAIPTPVRVSPQQTRWRVGDIRKSLATLSSNGLGAA